MRVTIRLQRGPVAIELEGESSENFEEELRRLQDLVKGHQIPAIQQAAGKVAGGEGPSMDLGARIQEYAEKIGIDTEQLAPVIKLDTDGPIILKPIPGSTNADRQRPGTVIILDILEEVYDERPVATEKLKSLLRKSGVHPEGLSDSWRGAEKGWVSIRGRGRSSSYEANVPGKEQARATIRVLAGG